MFSLDFYRTEDGKVPVEDFLDSLNIKMRNKALDSLSILEEFGNKLREPYSKPMGNGLYELRIRFSGDIVRVFYFFMIGNRIILTNGSVKKIERLQDWKLRRLGNTRRIMRGGILHERFTEVQRETASRP